MAAAPLVAVPNVSEGRDERRLLEFKRLIEQTRTFVLDLHRDAIHNRAVYTLAGDDDALVDGVTALAHAATEIDLTAHAGVHPRLGVLDVCPFVIDDDTNRAVRTAERAARSIADSAGLPVFLYGAAARRDATASLPELRRGGLDELRRRVRDEVLEPDEGPREIDPSLGVVCVGARPPLIAFNVWLRAGGDAARRIAARVRSAGGGLRGVRALGWEMDDAMSQVSLNLVAPDETGIDDAFEDVARWARVEDVEVVATEIVGLPLERYLPNEEKEAARLLLKPGRSLESALRSRF